VFFLWRHFAVAHSRDTAETKDAIDKEKAELRKRISEAKRSTDSNGRYMLSDLQQQLERL
jgi:flagellin-like hook-associated protein FlgL